MAKKKKRKRRPAPADATRAESAASSGASASRREKKEAARERRERAAKAQVRRGAVRRGLIGGLVGLVVFLGISWWNRTPAAKPYPQSAVDAGQAAQCSTVQTPSATPERGHLAPGEAHTYAEHPATSGVHDPTPLGSHGVYPSPVQETQAVHSLEHGSVIMYFRPTNDQGGLPKPVIDALSPIATNGAATYLIPYPDLPQDTALAYTAWNKLVTCPSTITPEQATTIANGFVDSFACSANAPEGKNGDGC